MSSSGARRFCGGIALLKWLQSEDPLCSVSITIAQRSNQMTFRATLSALMCLVASATHADTLWNHNGSIMRFSENGSNLSIYYAEPREGMVKEGVRPGDLFFNGVVVGSDVQGTARVFSAKCFKPMTFSISGQLLGQGSLILEGTRPKFKNCVATGEMKTDRLEFNYVSTLTPGLEALQNEAVQGVGVKPNFDCNKTLTKSEAAVCSSEELSLLDSEFGALFTTAAEIGEDGAAQKMAVAEYIRTENCYGDFVCIRSSKQTGINDLVSLLRAQGVAVSASLGEEMNSLLTKEIEAQRVAAEKEAASIKEAEEKENQEAQRDRRARAAATEAILSMTANADPNDVFIFENKSPHSPNLGVNLEGGVVSLTGQVSLCMLVDPVGGNPQAKSRHLKLIEKTVEASVPKGTKISELALPNCRHIVLVDYIVVQPALILGAPDKFVNLINSDLTKNFVQKGVLPIEQVEAEEAELRLALQKQDDEKRALSERLTVGLNAGSMTGAGALSFKVRGDVVCYVDSSYLGAGQNLSAAFARVLALDATKAFRSVAETSTSDPAAQPDVRLVPFSSLDQLFIGLQGSVATCSLVVGSGADLAKLLAGLNRLSVSYEVVPYWIEESELANFSDRAKSVQSRLESEKATTGGAEVVRQKLSTLKSETGQNGMDAGRASCITEIKARYDRSVKNNYGQLTKQYSLGYSIEEFDGTGAGARARNFGDNAIYVLLLQISETSYTNGSISDIEGYNRWGYCILDKNTGNFLGVEYKNRD